jgi:hypothetical protein
MSENNFFNNILKKKKLRNFSNTIISILLKLRIKFLFLNLYYYLRISRIKKKFFSFWFCFFIKLIYEKNYFSF